LVTVSFTVTASSGTPTGAVVVSDERGGGCTGSAPSGSCNYAPPGTGTRTITARYEGNASFRGSSGAAEHTVNEPPPPPNQPPTAADDAGITNEDASIVIAVLNNDVDPDGDPLSPSIETQPQNGTAEVNGDGTVTYTPSSDFFGEDSFTYRVSDGRGGTSEPATVRITVQPVNDAPRFSLDNEKLSANMNEATTEDEWARDISPGAGNESAEALTFLVNTDNTDLFTVAPSISANGTLTFTTGATEGEALVTVRLQDNGGTANGGRDTSDPQTFIIDISGGGDGDGDGGD
jgi:hypothetical protein